MEQFVDDVDVLVFHNYLQTREDIRADIERAKKVAAAARKQVMDDEMACIARANPYDVAIQEHLDAHVGYYLFGADDRVGTARVPGATSTASFILMARFAIRPSQWLSWAFSAIADPKLCLSGRTVKAASRAPSRKRASWLANSNGNWRAGLDIAEVAANLLESAQLVPLHELPTRQVELLRRGSEDRAALKALLEKDIAALQPYAQ